MRHMWFYAWPIVALLSPVRGAAQDFRQAPVSVTQQAITFALTTPVVHLSLADYAPTENSLFAGTTTFRLQTRPSSSIFLNIRWDMDESDGVNFSAWYDDQDNPAVVSHAYATPGKKTATFELKMYNTVGQEQRATKRVELFVVPFPTASYQDAAGNTLTYWRGADGVYDKPVLSIEGFDPENDDHPSGNYAQGFELAELARGRGYDLLFLDFADGGGDVARNKDIFLGACAFAHAKLAGLEAPLQVVGVSMGGTVARYGLAWAEEQSSLGILKEHYVNTFISFDAPQQGVHINPHLQDLFRERGSASQKLILQSTAARQLLYENTYGSFHDDFYRELTGLNNVNGVSTNGYPRKSKNFAVSNGNFAPDHPAKVAGVDPLATLTIYKALTLLFFDIDALAKDEVIVVQSVERDLWPGSTFTYDLRTLNNSGGRRKYFTGFPINLLFSGLGTWSFNVHFNPSYQPTEAALDYHGYTRASDGSIAGGSSWFDETLVQATARRHEELSTESREKVMAWLDGNRSRPYMGAVTNLTAAMTEESAVRISYSDPSIFESGVVIERKGEGGSFAVIGTAPPNAGGYTDRDPLLVPFARYTYRVHSIGAGNVAGGAAEISVIHQPHLVSSMAEPLGSGSQRRAAQTTAPYDNRFIAYESAGGSYLVRFVQEDELSGTWDRELPIGGAPTGATSYRGPSLFPDSSGAAVRIVYEEVDAIGGARMIRQAVFNDATGTVSVFPEPIAQVLASPGFQSMPVAVMTDHVENKPPAIVAALWRYEMNSGLALGLGTAGSGGVQQWTSVDLNGGIFPDPVVAATNPSIAAVLRTQGNPPAYHIYAVWEEGNRGGAFGGIRLLHGKYTPGAQPWPPAASQIVWEQGRPFTVAQNTAGEIHRRPSVAVDGSGSVVVAWESSSPTSGKVLVQKRDGLTSGYVVAATAAVAAGSGSSGMPHGVSLAEYRSVAGSADNLVLAWHTDGGGAYAAWYHAAANCWSAPRLLDAALRQPNIASSKGATAAGRVAASVTSAGPPYAIRSFEVGALPPPLPAPQLAWQPVIVNNVKRARLSWSAAGPDLQSYSVMMYTCDGGAPDCGSEAYHALQASTQSQTYTDLNTVIFTKSGTNPAPERTNYYYVAGRDRFGQSGLPSNRIAVNTDEEIVWKRGAAEDGGALPRAYALSENFPNPFNPSTTFRYELPAPGEVKFVVYNMIGEAVMTIVDLSQEAGYYEAAWDASASPSGVYVAVMRVTGGTGRVVYSAAKKVLLVR